MNKVLYDISAPSKGREKGSRFAGDCFADRHVGSACGIIKRDHAPVPSWCLGTLHRDGVEASPRTVAQDAVSST
jgi:hypothetical protein